MTDGKIGDLAQCRGVARQLTTPKNVREQVVSPDWFHALPLPWTGVQKSDHPSQPDSPLHPPAPDIVLASGRRTLPYLRAFRRQRGKAMRPLIVFLKDPRFGRSAVDFVWAPVHDGLTGNNCLSTHTSPHGFDTDTLKDAAKRGANRFVELNEPRIGIILGGNSGSVKWDEASSRTFAHRIGALPKDCSFLVTPSRRTPLVLQQAIAMTLANRPHFFWDGSGANPYAEILATADRLIVTGDSHNMVSECLAARKPVHVFRPPRLQRKLHAFLDAMETMGAISNFEDGLKDFKPVHVDATAEIAVAIRNVLAAQDG